MSNLDTELRTFGVHPAHIPDMIETINAVSHTPAQLRTACAHPKETQNRVPDGYEPALEIRRTPEQRRARDIKAAAFAAIDQQAEAASIENAAHFRAMENQNQNRAKYPAPDPYAAALAALKAGKR